jgi:hypothetical protein
LHRTIRPFICLGVLSVLVATLSGPASGETTTTTTTTTTTADPGFPEVTADLGARSFRQVLPYDVPFQIVGSVPTGARRIEVQFAESRKKIDTPTVVVPVPPEDLVAQCEARGTKPAEASPGVPWQPVPPIFWKKVDLVEPADEPSFRVTVPPLDALRYYLFRFDIQVDPTTGQAEAFQKKAASVIDQGLKGVTSAELSPDASRALRMDLIRALRQVVGEGDIIAPGTLFDPCTDDKAVYDEFNRNFAAIMGPQRSRRITLQGTGAMQSRLQQNLQSITADQDLRNLVTSLQTKAQTDPVAAGVLRGNEDALALVTLTSVQVTDRATGVAPQGGSAAADLWTTPDATVVTQFSQNYQDTRTRLDALKGWLAGQVASSSPLAKLTQPGGAIEEARRAALNLQSQTGLIRDAVAGRQQAVQQMAALYKEQVLSEVTVDATTTGNGNTFQNYYISADLGFVFMPDITEAVPYVGTNIYTRPVNRNAPLSQRGGFRRRFAFTIGLTLESIADKNMRTRDDFTGNQSLLVGAGYRVTESIRLGLGGLVFVKKDPSPLVDEDTTGVTPYVSVSFDWNIARTFRGIGSTFFANAP